MVKLDKKDCKNSMTLHKFNINKRTKPSTVKALNVKIDYSAIPLETTLFDMRAHDTEECTN